MKKLYSLLLLSLCFIATINAQEVTYYYLNNNVRTLSKDSATYYIKFNPTKNGLVSFQLYCSNNSLKEAGTMQNTTTLIREGENTTFYTNGNIKDITQYTAGLPNGLQTHYFADGKLNFKIINSSAGYGNSLKQSGNIKYLFCADDSGNITLQDGNGYFTAYNDDNKIIQEGNVINTNADGLWKGFEDGKLKFVEIYKGGDLLKGESYAADGKVYNYQQRTKRPEPKGGINNFYNYVASAFEGINLNDAKMMMKFTVDVSGNLKNVEVINSSDQKINNLAINTLKNAPKWNPALEQGKPIQVAYYMPISIK